MISPKKSKLKITVARHSGFCFGVKRAYDLALTNSKNGKKSYVLGRLVHNNEVVKKLKERGIEEVKKLNQIKSGSIIFTAHGEGPEIYELAKRAGLNVIDATCPKVIKVQRLAKNHIEKGDNVIIFGDKEHKEVKSIFAWTDKKAKIVRNLAELKKFKLDKSKRYILLSQTTQNVEEFQKIIKYLKNELKNFKHFNTICPSTSDRQEEIRKLAKDNGVIIVIGGKDSANSKRLYDISKSINSRSHFVENASQLKKNWFNDIEKVGIAAGASTPEWAIKAVVKKISARR
ncbi:MAG: 4-hydroxy-3-methylbut-2-enyl diphosphate reductase [Parcubacteria group bacterium]|jgi:4-hydroxy-3-methylbut-2-enyl diphosphate reductase